MNDLVATKLLAGRLEDELHCRVYDSSTKPGQEYLVDKTSLREPVLVTPELFTDLTTSLNLNFACRCLIREKWYYAFGSFDPENQMLVGGMNVSNTNSILNVRFALNQEGGRYIWRDDNKGILFTLILIPPIN